VAFSEVTGDQFRREKGECRTSLVLLQWDFSDLAWRNEESICPDPIDQSFTPARFGSFTSTRQAPRAADIMNTQLTAFRAWIDEHMQESTSGQALVEYAIILVLVALVAVVSMGTLGSVIRDHLYGIAGAMFS
jgi:Flp pilus assembly pilin Flp